jgi:hypothetical protein
MDIESPEMSWRAEFLPVDAKPMMMFAIEIANMIVGKTRNSARGMGEIGLAESDMLKLKVYLKSLEVCMYAVAQVA